METSAYHHSNGNTLTLGNAPGNALGSTQLNGSFTHAQTVLNWDPSSLEIKTRSVEKTLEPLVVQVSIFKQ